MTIEDKCNLALDIATRAKVDKDKDIVLSIAEGIKNDRFFCEIVEGNTVLFLTWKDNLIDKKRYIFIENLYVDPMYRSSKTLTRVRTALKYFLKGVYKFYWFNREKQKMVYRS